MNYYTAIITPPLILVAYCYFSYFGSDGTDCKIFLTNQSSFKIFRNIMNMICWLAKYFLRIFFTNSSQFISPNCSVPASISSLECWLAILIFLFLLPPSCRWKGACNESVAGPVLLMKPWLQWNPPMCRSSVCHDPVFDHRDFRSRRLCQVFLHHYS